MANLNSYVKNYVNKILEMYKQADKTFVLEMAEYITKKINKSLEHIGVSFDTTDIHGIILDFFNEKREELENVEKEAE